MPEGTVGHPRHDIKLGIEVSSLSMTTRTVKHLHSHLKLGIQALPYTPKHVSMLSSMSAMGKGYF